MTLFRKAAVLTAVSGLVLGLSGVALAGGPEPGAIGFQPPVTPVAQKMHDFHNFLLWIITAISVFVLGLLAYVMYRFAEKRNPTPTKTTHNTLIEVLWTTIPIIILVIIAIPSFQLLYFADRIEDADMTIKAIGKQWYWTYEYPDHGGLTFDAIMVPDDEIEDGQIRLLSTDNALVLPVDTNIRVLVTAGDVLHNFALPSFGIKMDGVPGRINETWAYVPAEYAGETFYGQCSELCGTGHSYMPIEVKMLSKAEFAEWVEKAKEEFAQIDQPGNRVELAVSAAQEDQ